MYRTCRRGSLKQSFKFRVQRSKFQHRDREAGNWGEPRGMRRVNLELWNVKRETWDFLMVFLNRIYTKSGDGGETGLGDGARVPKDHVRVAAFGEVDELNSVLGLVLANCPD